MKKIIAILAIAAASLFVAAGGSATHPTSAPKASASTCQISQTSISGSTKCTSFSFGTHWQRARTFCFYNGQSLDGIYVYGVFTGLNTWSLAVCPWGTTNLRFTYETIVQFL